jgi:hypothetical protein
MAKKVVASFQVSTGKGFTKVIRMVKSGKKGAYVFRENIIPSENVKEFLDKELI